MRCRRQQQQSIGFVGQHLGQAAALAFVADAMMRLVDDHQVPACAFQFRQAPGPTSRNPSTSGTMPSHRTDCRQAPAHGERSAGSTPSAMAVKRRPKRTRISCSHWRSSGPGGHTIRMRCARRRTRSSAAINPGLDGLAQADAIRQQQPWPHHVQRPQQRHALIGLDRHPARRHGRARNLLQQPRDVVTPPFIQATRLLWPRIGAQDRKRLRGMKHVPLQPCQIPGGTGQPHALLTAKLLDADHIPFQPTRRDLDPDRHFHARFPLKRGHGNRNRLPNT